MKFKWLSWTSWFVSLMSVTVSYLEFQVEMVVFFATPLAFSMVVERRRARVVVPILLHHSFQVVLALWLCWSEHRSPAMPSRIVD